MAKRRVTRPKGPKHISEQEGHATSPPPIDVEPSSILDANSTAKPRPKPRPKPATNTALAPPVPDTVNDLDIPQQRPKRGRSRSDADPTAPASIDQPPAKKKKEPNTTSPVKRDGNKRWDALPLRSPLPARTNRVVNPGGPDKKRKKRTSAEVAAAAQQKQKLRLELENLEKQKIRMLAEMEKVEEEEELEEERMGIKDMTDLAEPVSETGIRDGMARDNDVVMADGADYEETFVDVDRESELDGLDSDTVKMVSGLIQNNVNFADDHQRAVQQKKKVGRPKRERGDIRAAVDKEKGRSWQKTRCLFFIIVLSILFLTTIIIYRLINNQCQIR